MMLPTQRSIIQMLFEIARICLILYPLYPKLRNTRIFRLLASLRMGRLCIAINLARALKVNITVGTNTPQLTTCADRNLS